jgi:hypothetical protein
VSRRWLVLRAEAFEVEADTETEALDLVAGDPDRAPVYSSAEAEPLAPPVTDRPLRVLA